MSELSARPEVVLGEESADRLRGLDPVQSVAIAFRCVLRALPCMATAPEVLHRFNQEDFEALDQLIRRAAGVLLARVLSIPDESLGREGAFPTELMQESARRLSFASSPAGPALRALLALMRSARALTVGEDASEPAMEAVHLAAEVMLSLERLSAQDGPGPVKAFRSSLEADLAVVLQTANPALLSISVLPLFLDNPLWKPEVPASLAQLLGQWESGFLETARLHAGAGRTCESTVALVRALWAGELPVDVFLDGRLAERIQKVRESANPLPRLLAMAPQDLARRLVHLASRDRKLLPFLASPGRATLESLAKSHGRHLLDAPDPEGTTVPDPLWLAWYGAVLGRVMVSMGGSVPGPVSGAPAGGPGVGSSTLPRVAEGRAAPRKKVALKKKK